MIENIDILNLEDISSIKDKINDKTLNFSDKIKKVHKSLI